MRPQLEELESRTLPDAILAMLYMTEIVPAATQQHMLMDQIHVQELQYVLAAVQRGVDLVPSASVNAAASNVLEASAAFAAAIPQSDAALASYLSSETMLMYQLPPLGNEQALVDSLLTTMVSTQSQLNGVLRTWQPIGSS